MEFESNFEHVPEYVLVRTDVEVSQGITGTDQLVDHRKLPMKNLASSDMNRIKNFIEKHGKKLGDGRSAFVVTDALGFGMTRMYELLRGEDIHSDIRVFYSVSEAVEWLKH